MPNNLIRGKESKHFWRGGGAKVSIERRETCFGNVAERIYFSGFGDETLFLPILFLKSVRTWFCFSWKELKKRNRKKK